MTTSQLPATRVLIVEDEEELRDAMISFLALEGLAAQGVGSLDATESWMQSQDFDVLGIPVHRDRRFRPNVTGDSGGS